MPSRPQDSIKRKAMRDSKRQMGLCIHEGCKLIAYPSARCINHAKAMSNQRDAKAKSNGHIRWRRGKFNIKPWHIKKLLAETWIENPMLREHWDEAKQYVSLHPELFFRKADVILDRPNVLIEEITETYASEQ